jgi:hypothetical protein
MHCRFPSMGEMMKLTAIRVRVLVVLGALFALAACPLPYNFGGPAPGSPRVGDPASPTVTAPVELRYTQTEGANGILSNGDEVVTVSDTVLNFSTETRDATIYYTTDGSSLSDLSSAERFDASEGSLSLPVRDGAQVLEITAIAIGPQMLPSPIVSASLTVSPFPVVELAVDNVVIAEEGGSAEFTLSLSRAPTSDLTITLSTSGTYESSDLDGIVGPGSSFTLTIPAGQTSASFTVTAQPDVGEYDNETLRVALDEGANYTVGVVGDQEVSIADSLTPILSLSVSESSIQDDAPGAVFTVTSSIAPTAPVTVNLSTSGTYEPADISGLPASGSAVTATLAAGDTSATISITPSPDDNDFDNETVTLTLESGSGYVVSSAADATLTVLDSTVPPLGFSTSTVGGSLTAGNPIVLDFEAAAPLLSSTEIRVRVTGNFESLDLGGLGGPGLELTVPISAGDTGETVSIATNEDLGEWEDEDITFEILPNSGYVVDTAESQRSYTLVDSTPVPTIEISASTNSATVGNSTGTSIKITVTANPAPTIDTDVFLTLSGDHEPSFMTAPWLPGPVPGIRIPAGQTSATASFQVNAQTYLERHVVGVNVASDDSDDTNGKYQPGTTSSTAFALTDAEFGDFEYVAFYDFEEGTLANQTSPVGTGATMSITNDGTPPDISLNLTAPPFESNSHLAFTGEYDNDWAEFVATNGAVNFVKDLFTLYVDFRLASQGGLGRDIIVGGRSARWSSARISTSGELIFTFSNYISGVSGAAAPTGVSLAPGTRYQLVVNLNTSNSFELNYWLFNVDSGQLTGPTAIDVPAFLPWNTITDEVFLSENRSTGIAFNGSWHDVFVANGTLSRFQVLELIGNHTALNS